MKIYGVDPQAERRYSPSICLGSECKTITGSPGPEVHLDGLHRTPEPYDADVDAAIYAADQWLFKEDRESSALRALHHMHYNFVKIHKTLRVTPAMEAGIETRLWSIEEIVGLLDRRAEVAA